MTIESGTPRSRRTLLAAGLAAGAATVATALVRTETARAAAPGVFDSALPSTAAVTATNTSVTGSAYGVFGQSNSTGGRGTYGYATATTGGSTGVQGRSDSTSGRGVHGYAAATTGATSGVLGTSNSATGTGVFGRTYATTGRSYGVYGQSDSSDGCAAFGIATSFIGVTYGLYGRVNSPLGTAVIGYNGTGADPVPVPKTGVYGYAAQDFESNGVRGESPAGTGVRGASVSGAGVRGTSTSGNGVIAESESGVGVFANVGATSTAGVFGNSNGGPGVWGQTDGASAGAVGWSNGGARTGVLGYSGSDSLPDAPAKTGVYGYAAQDSNAHGVYGRSTSGQGVRGQASTGIAGYFVTAKPTNGVHTGVALQAVGRVKFDRCVGIATIANGATATTAISPGIDLTSTSVVTATLMGSAGGTVTVHRVSVNTTANTFTIVLTGPVATASVKVGWHVFG